MAGIRWYSTDPDLSTRERGAVDLPAALAVVDRYLDDLKPRYGTGEEALARTTFGFSRSDTNFIEICVHARDRISLRAEAARKGMLGRLRGPTQTERTLDSAEALKRHVSAYFRMSADEFAEYLARGDRA